MLWNQVRGYPRNQWSFTLQCLYSQKFIYTLALIFSWSHFVLHCHLLVSLSWTRFSFGDNFIVFSHRHMVNSMSYDNVPMQFNLWCYTAIELAIWNHTFPCHWKETSVKISLLLHHSTLFTLSDSFLLILHVSVISLNSKPTTSVWQVQFFLYAVHACITVLSMGCLCSLTTWPLPDLQHCYEKNGRVWELTSHKWHTMIRMHKQSEFLGSVLESFMSANHPTFHWTFQQTELTRHFQSALHYTAYFMHRQPSLFSWAQSRSFVFNWDQLWHYIHNIPASMLVIYDVFNDI